MNRTGTEDQQGWGSRVISRLAGDLRAEFPDMKGFSPRNLQYMTTYARQWGAGNWPWGHIRTIIDKSLTPSARDWYTAAAVEYGWSRNVLMNMIMNNSIERTGAAPSNFTRQLASPDSELVQQVAKDPYAFEVSRAFR